MNICRTPNSHWLLLVVLPALFGGSGSAFSAARTWDGGGTNNFWATPANWAGDVAPVAGDDLIFPSGVARLSCSNNFPAGTIFNPITLGGGGYYLQGSSLVLNAGVLATNGAGVNQISFSLQLGANQTFSNAAANVLYFSSQTIDLNGHDLTLGTVSGGEMAQLPGCSIVGAGGLIKTGAGYLYLGSEGSNTYSGSTEIRNGTLFVQGAQAFGSTNVGTTVSVGALLEVAGTFTFPEPVVLYGEVRIGGTSFGTNVWTGPITLMTNNVMITVSPAARADFNGAISGPGGLTRVGSGVLVLNATNTYTGVTTNHFGGWLLINGRQPQSPVVLWGGTNGGTGVVGNITALGPLFRALNPGANAGVLTCSNLTLRAGPGSTTLAVELNGLTPGSGYDQLKVFGTVALTNATLSVALGFSPAAGDTFVIIDNDGVEPIAGTIIGLSEGSLHNIAGQPFRISYVGGDGNDLTLTRHAPPAVTIQSFMLAANGFSSFAVTNALVGYAYTIQAATNLNSPVVWSNLAAALPNFSGNIFFTDTNAPLFPSRFYRIRLP